MRRIIATAFAVIVLTMQTIAQLYDAQWVISSNVSVLDFRDDTLVNYPISKYMGIFLTSATICDEYGNLLFYTNGIYVADATGAEIYNGDSLSPCPYTTEWASNGLNIRQAALFLPESENNNVYYPFDGNIFYLFHFSNDTLSDTRPGTLYYSILAPNADEIYQKNIVFCKGIFRGGGMTACKHANGRDWWIIIGESNNNCFDKFLLTPDTILGPYKQCIGPEYSLPYDNAYSKFSQDGSKYVTGAIEGDVLVMDFDRCTGEFSNPVEIFNEASPGISGCAAVEFSPNGRFVYVSDNINMNQYDLESSNVEEAVELYSEDSIQYSGVDFLQLAPNGKIYGSTWSGGFYFLHVINNPDELGDSCGFVDTGFVTLTANSNNLPNMVNYKLGTLVGSGCDTITTDINQQTQAAKQIRIQPNPADKYVYVEMPRQGDYELDLLNEAGQLIARKQTRQVDIFDTEGLPPGVYFVKAVNKQNSYSAVAQKVIVAH